MLRLLSLVLVVVVAGCGENARFTISGSSSTSQGSCSPYLVTRLKQDGSAAPVSSSTVIQPELSSGLGLVATDVTCTTLPVFNLMMAENTNTVTFYYQAPGSSTTAVLKAGEITTEAANKGSITVTVP